LGSSEVTSTGGFFTSRINNHAADATRYKPTKTFNTASHPAELRNNTGTTNGNAAAPTFPHMLFKALKVATCCPPILIATAFAQGFPTAAQNIPALINTTADSLLSTHRDPPTNTAQHVIATALTTCRATRTLPDQRNTVSEITPPKKLPPTSPINGNIVRTPDRTTVSPRAS
jgi:hypothetical protein